ncbi:FAD/FMN-containing dehydrogenase [Agromyces terreus]|uniref:FAD/FMN-containing dehydrogenase n=1 Tax=Agromyces terreus TaxID=424795 RepID=A0A9X2H098_9MICO|nr:FAD-binding oxidoreductase [Agromyces terreus]MCP2370806.1 FAD/FMN-containing dehydrogenase [Agromyces terreus]
MNTPVSGAASSAAQPAESVSVIVDASTVDASIAAEQIAPVVDLASARISHELAELGRRLDGRLSLPGDAGWNADRTAWNLAVDQRPAAVVVAGSADDAVETVRVAAALGLGVAAQATGHNAAPLAAQPGFDEVLLIRLSELRGVEIDVEARVARIQPGAQWGDVVAAAAPHGLAALAGSSHDVGVMGYTLGGGVSWLARSHGLAANQVLAAEIVTADGRLRRIDAEHDADLFWAVRGGGGDFGVVTALEFRLFPIAEVVAGMLLWPLDAAELVLPAWAAWTAELPDSVTSTARVMRLPALPELPPFLSGRELLLIEAVCQESPDRAAELLAPLRAFSPEIDTVHPQPVAELLQLHMDPPEPSPAFGDGMMLSDLTPEAVRAFLDAVGPGADTTLLVAELRHLGGALDPDAALALAAEHDVPAPGIVAGFDARYLVFAGGIPMPGVGDALVASLGRLFSRIEPWRAPVEYLNFSESRRPAERLFGERVHRLRAIKRAVDPNGLIRSNHPVLG